MAIPYAAARRMMVDGQLRTNAVTDSRVLDAFGAIPRERFVPESLADLAYLDRDLPFGRGGRVLLKPMVLARLIQAAELEETDRVLDVGGGSGYGAAIMAQLAAEVVALEEEASLSAKARGVLLDLGIPNVVTRTGPLAEGAPDSGPYDAIVLEGAIERLPDAFTPQLAPGGRLVCICQEAGVSRARLYRRVETGLSGRPLFDAAAPVLPGFAAERTFVF